MEMFEIYFGDLTQDAQQRFLDFMDLASPEEGNFDIFSIAEIPKPEE